MLPLAVVGLSLLCVTILIVGVVVWVAFSKPPIACCWWILDQRGDAPPISREAELNDEEYVFVVVKAEVPHRHLKVSDSGTMVTLSPAQFTLHGVGDTALSAQALGLGPIGFVQGTFEMTQNDNERINDPFTVKPLFAVPRSAVDSGNLSFQANDSSLIPLTAENQESEEPKS